MRLLLHASVVFLSLMQIFFGVVSSELVFVAFEEEFGLDVLEAAFGGHICLAGLSEERWLRLLEAAGAGDDWLQEGVDG